MKLHTEFSVAIEWKVLQHQPITDDGYLPWILFLRILQQFWVPLDAQSTSGLRPQSPSPPGRKRSGGFFPRSLGSSPIHFHWHRLGTPNRGGRDLATVIFFQPKEHLRTCFMLCRACALFYIPTGVPALFVNPKNSEWPEAPGPDSGPHSILQLTLPPGNATPPPPSSLPCTGSSSPPIRRTQSNSPSYWTP